mgnify:FL=1|tara:strand:+ start:568 stop:1209 length:642 start_codon:yes stop_codon:yes gene_type:complete
MFICEDISFDIDGQKLFTNINLNLKPQKDLLITGPSGVGKTTLLSILCGLQKPTNGSIIYNDINLYNLAEDEIDNFRGKNLGIVFQNFNLINSFTVKQNLEIAANAIGNKSSDQYFNLLDRIGLADKSHIKVANLSIGEKQRLAVARAFVGEPQWIFCDEPTSSLDDKNANIIANLIKEESSRCEASLVLITHDSRIQTLINFSKILRLGEEL